MIDKQFFDTKTEVIAYLTEKMGSEGSEDQALKVYDFMEEKNVIHVLDRACGDCIELDNITDEYFFELWDKATTEEDT